MKYSGNKLVIFVCSNRLYLHHCKSVSIYDTVLSLVTTLDVRHIRGNLPYSSKYESWVWRCTGSDSRNDLITMIKWSDQYFLASSRFFSRSDSTNEPVSIGSWSWRSWSVRGSVLDQKIHHNSWLFHQQYRRSQNPQITRKQSLEHVLSCVNSIVGIRWF